MNKPYKLKEEIRQFIIEEKQKNPKLSCRAFIPLIRELFQVSLSKSLINNVIKLSNLSSPVVKIIIKEPAQATPEPAQAAPEPAQAVPEPAQAIPEQVEAKPEQPKVIEDLIPVKQEAVIISQPIEIKFVRRDKEYIENGGCFFLKAAEYQSSIIVPLTQQLSKHFPSVSVSDLQVVVEASIFMPIFENKRSLWVFIGKEISLDCIYSYSQQLGKIPFTELNHVLAQLGISSNILNINELHKECLIKMSSYVQRNFFPEAYGFLDFNVMRERFYSLSAKIEEDARFLKVRLLYPRGFQWRNDIVWQEDLSYGANNINTSNILTKGNSQIWIYPSPEIAP